MGLIEIKPEFSERESRAVQNVNNAYLAQRIAIGTILPFAGNTIPDGTLLCDGQAVSRTEYAELFAKIGTTYGAGDGVNTFNVPNLKGRVPVGKDGAQFEFYTLGKTGGHKRLQSHSHSVSGTTSTATLTGWMNNAAVQSANVGLSASGVFTPRYTAGQTVGYATESKEITPDYVDGVDFDATHSHSVSGSTSTAGTGTGENLPPYLTVNYIIIAKSDVSHGDIETALADLIVETQSARDNANTAAGEVRSEMAGIKAVDGIVKGDGAGNFSAADAGDMPITDEDEHFTAGTVEGALEELADNKVDKVTGKALSTNDYTDADKVKVDNLPADTNTALSNKADKDTTYTKTEVDTALGLKANQDTTYTKEETDTALADKADKSALTETNLRIATVDKSLSDYQNAIASININQSPKQTTSGYGAVSLPVNAANGQISASVGGNTVTDENGTAHTISAGRLVSANEDETEKTYQYYPDCGLLRSLPNGTNDEISFNQQTGQWEHIKRVSDEVIIDGNITAIENGNYTNTYRIRIASWCDEKNVLQSTSNSGLALSDDGNYEILLSGGDLDTKTILFYLNYMYIYAEKSKVDLMPGATVVDKFKAYLNQYPITLTYQLAEPIVTPVNVTGTLVAHPNGNVYWEPVLPVAGIYTAEGISVTDTDYAIDSIERIAKIDFATGVETEVDVSQAVIAGDGLSFTHPDLIDGDIVFFTYYHAVEGTQPEITAEYYDSRYTVKDTETEQFYRWKVSVANGVPSLEIEVV